jgi:tight adherence protein C
LLGLLGALVIGAAVFFLLFTALVAQESSAVENRLRIDWSTEDTSKDPIYIKLTRPLLKGAFLEMASGFWKPEKLERWKIQLISAGFGRRIEPEHFVASKFWLAVCVTLLILLMQLFQGDGVSPAFILGIGVFAFFFPNMDLSSRRSARQLEIRLSMPYVVDLLTLSLEAGLDFMGAIGKVVERAPASPLVEELSNLLKDVQLGKTRSQALRAMADRIDMPEMSSFVAVLISSTQMGASIGLVLRAQSDTMRVERLNKAEKMGAQASQKILIPLVLLILPAVGLVILGPFILQIALGGGAGF